MTTEKIDFNAGRRLIGQAIDAIEEKLAAQAAERGDYHGWGLRGGVTLFVGQFPTRKSLALYVADGTTLEPLAYFRSPAAARRAMAIIDRLVGVPPRQP